MPIIFPPHPRLEYTAVELAAWQADPARQEEMQRAIRQADALLDKPLAVPQQEGSWIFYYACPDDDATLRAETPEKHVCPRCGKGYTDERTQAAYRTKLNYQLDRDCRALALAYALTGEVKYAAPVRAVMLELARLYPTFERHDRWGRRGPLASIGGWRYVQMLDEAVSAIDLSRAYDLVATADCLSAEDRRTIEEELLGHIARSIRQYQYFSDRKNNHRTWYNAAYANIAVAVGDAALLREAVHAEGGLLWQLEHSVTVDGLWYEGAMAYHFYALQAVMATLDAARRAGWSFADDPRLKSLWLGPMQSTYPNGAFPVINDSDPASLNGYKWAYGWAYRYFDDARFAGLAGETAAEPAPLGSADLAGIGLGVLRRHGENPLCAMIDYGIHGGGHGHPDKMSIVLYGLGRELLLDPGRISYSVPEYRTWCRTTAAHNTVAINGEDQQEDTGRMLFFTETPRYTAALAASDGEYPGYALRRFLLLADDLLVDVFAVRGERQARLDWFLHGRGTPAADVAMVERAQPLGTANGYQHLKELQQGAGATAATFTFTLDDGKFYRVHCVGEADSTFVTGMGIGYHLNDRVPFLLRRREAASTVFVTVYDLSGTQTVDRVERVSLTQDGKPVPETDGVGLLIHTKNGVQPVGLDLRDAPEKPLALRGTPVERCLFP